LQEKRKEHPTEIDKLWILLGSNDISKDNEFGRQNVSAEEIIIHENWNPKSISYNDDIALIRLSSSVTFDEFIQPICLMTNDQVVSNGKVAGWGSVDNSGTPADIAKIAELKTLSLVKCLLRNHELVRIAWEDSFCAHSEVNGVCKGDSGSGFYVHIQNKKYLKGLVSSSVARDCSENSTAIYTDVSKYYGFIKVTRFNIYLFIYFKVYSPYWTNFSTLFYPLKYI
jgi:secreted trypsin-like serine protease